MATVTAEQRANTNPVIQEWVRAKDKENATPSQADPNLVKQLSDAANQFKATNWGPTGTANGQTESQNLAAVINQPGNPVANNPSDYLKSVLAQASQDNANQSSGTSGNGNASVTNGVISQAGPPTPPQGNSNSLIQSIYDSMYASQSQKLKANRDAQLAGLAGQDDLANQSAASSLNANDVSGARLSNQLREQMANLGLLQGGDFISQQLAQNTGQQQNANNIKQDQLNTLKNLLAQKDAINNNASADDLALLQSIQSQQGQAQLNQNNADRSYGLDLAGLTGDLNGQKTLGAQSLGLQAQNQGFNQNLATNQYNQGVRNDAFNQGMANKQFDYQKVQDDIKNGQWSTQTDNQMKQWAEGNKLDWAQFNQQTKQALAQIAISQQNATTNATQAYNSNLNQQADNKLQQDKFAYDTDKNNIDNLYKQSQIDKNTADAQKQGLDDAYYKAVTLAQKDPLFGSYDAAKQSQIINTHYDNLKPKDAVSNNDINQYLKK